MLKRQPVDRSEAIRRAAKAKAERPILGVVRSSGRAIVSAELNDPGTAAKLKAEAQRRALARGEVGLKDGLLCWEHDLSCPSEPDPVFRAVQLPLNAGDDVLDIEIRVLESGIPTEALEGYEILDPAIQLALEIEATVRDDQGGTRQVLIEQPAFVSLSDGTGGAIDNGENVCSRLYVEPGGFTYKNARESALHFSHLEPDGSPCCYIPTEYLNVTVVVDAEVNDGQGGTSRITKRAGTTVESSPQPADPCHVRAVHEPVPEFSPFFGYHWAEVGSVYLTDACGNIVYDVGLNDSQKHTLPGDEFLVTSPVVPFPEPPGVWAEVPEVIGGTYFVGQFHLALYDNFTTFPPSGLTQEIEFSVASQSPQCSPGGRITGSYTVHLDQYLPAITIWWDPKHDGVGFLAPDLGIVPPGAPVRDHRTGSVAVWRTPAHDGTGLEWYFPGGYEGIPVRLYVAKEVLVFDNDGDLDETYLQPVEGVGLCTGMVELQADTSGSLDTYTGSFRTSCYEHWDTVASGAARSDPAYTGHAPGEWVEMGLAVGITTAPTEAGRYVLVVEPLEGDPRSEPFRRGDSWAINQVGNWSDAFWSFEVGGESCNLDDLSCASCEECAGGDIGLRNGNVRHAESDPAPGLPPILLDRTYDSLNPEVGVYGVGWFSAYDALASTESWTAMSGEAVEQVTIATEDNRNLVFVATNGGDFRQTLPVSGSSNTLNRDGADLVLELDGDPFRRTFRGSDGKLEEVREISTDRAYTISYDGSTGLPTDVSDSWKGTVATFSPINGKIAGVTAGGTTATFDYGGDSTLDTVSVGSKPWRAYAYTADDELEIVSDGAGYIIDSFGYSGGVALSSTSASGSILSVAWSPGRTSEETMAEVVSATGSTTYYYLRQIAGRHRVVEVAGDCSCSGNDRVYGYDPLGHLVLEQDAMGYLTYHTYTGDGRKQSTEVGLRRPDCDPAAFPDPYACRLTPDGLIGLAGTTLTQTEAYGATWYAYDDANWPDRPTQVCRYSTLQDGGEPRTTCRFQIYDVDTGQWLTSTVSGWTGQSAAAAVEEARTTTRTLYDGVLTAAFDPGGSFNPAWLSLPQPSGKVQAIDGPRSDVVDQTLLVYYPTDLSVPADLRGQLAAQRDPEGGITRYEDYDSWGHARRMVGPTGITTESTYDDLGRVLTSKIVANAGCNSVDDPLCSTDLVTTYAYEANGGPLSTITSPEGNVTHFEYDTYGRTLDKSRGPSVGDLRERMHSVYDPVTGLLTESTTDRMEAGWVEYSRTDYQHTSSGQVDVVTRPRYDGDLTPSVETYVFDAAGRIESLEDPNHDDPNTTYEYDPLGRLTMVRQLVDPDDPGGPVWAETTYGYDIHGNLTSVTDANGNLTQYVVDDFGQTTLIVSPVTGATQLTYNAAGQVLTRTDSRGVTTTTTYDAAGRPTQVDSEDGVNPIETLFFNYDDAGRRVLAQSPDVTETFTYDRRGAVLTVSSNRGGTVYDTSHTYTADGALDTITYPSGRIVKYDHDFAGRPTAVTAKAPGAGTFEPVLSNLSYLPYGPAEHLEYGPTASPLTEDRGFDWHYRRTNQTIASTLDLDLGYDPAGNLTGITDAIGQRTASYGYDDLGRLTSASWGAGAQTRAYDYDPIGNLERIGVNTGIAGEGEVLLGYDLNPSTNNSPVLSSVDTYEGVSLTSSYTVATDTAGNITDDGQAGYDYTLRNHLESRTLGVETSTYTFSADGRRVGMTRGATSMDVILGLGGRRLSRVLNGATRDYVWLGDTLVGYFDGTATEPVRVITSHIGFPLMAIDPSGTTIWDPLHEPYGELIGTFSKTADPGLRYPGQWQDEVELEGSCVGDDCTMPGPLGGSVSLFENGFRWYRTAWGRYSQADPIGLRGGMNLFSYVGSNPLRYRDPLGLRRCCPDEIRRDLTNILRAYEEWLRDDLYPGAPLPDGGTHRGWGPISGACDLFSGFSEGAGAGCGDYATAVYGVIKPHFTDCCRGRIKNRFAHIVTIVECRPDTDAEWIWVTDLDAYWWGWIKDPFPGVD
jgi:YD repeat-containing protein